MAEKPELRTLGGETLDVSKMGDALRYGYLMRRRDHFAAAALTGSVVCASIQNMSLSQTTEQVREKIAKEAIALADVMLAMLKQSAQTEKGK